MGDTHEGLSSLFLHQAFSNELQEYKCGPPRGDNPLPANPTSAFPGIKFHYFFCFISKRYYHFSQREFTKGIRSKGGPLQCILLVLVWSITVCLTLVSWLDTQLMEELQQVLACLALLSLNQLGTMTICLVTIRLTKMKNPKLQKTLALYKLVNGNLPSDL